MIEDTGRPAIREGDFVDIALGGGVHVTGTLLKVMSEEGQTDGLLKVNQQGEIVFVYERHIRTLRRIS